MRIFELTSIVIMSNSNVILICRVRDNIEVFLVNSSIDTMIIIIN